MDKQTSHQSTISRIITDINNSKIDDSHWSQYLDTLEKFECWQPLFRLLKQKLSDPHRRETKDYVRLARIYSLYLENIERSAEICKELMQNFPVDYKRFRMEMLSEITGEEDYGNEAVILETIFDELGTDKERIECLERMCLIFEKKKYDEEKLNSSYEDLIRLDPTNTKALRYFKAVFTQSQDWENVVRILKVLYESSRHKNDAFRIAQELATVYLFQLDLPQSCLDVLDAYCQESPLDTSSLYYESSYRKRDWRGCLEVLSSYLTKVDNETNRAIIYLKMGELHELLQDVDSAIDCYEMSYNSQKNLLESLENLIEISIEQKRWPMVMKWLKCMKDTTDKPHLKERLEEAIIRIEDGLKKA